MSKNIKEQRKEFVQNLRENVLTYKAHIFSDKASKSKLDAKKIRQDWENVAKDFPINEK